MWCLPLEEDFYDTYEDGAYDLGFAEEYMGQKPVHWLCNFLQGGMPMTLRIKGAMVVKNDNLPFIFVSNKSIDEVYHNVKPVSMAALKERFTERKRKKGRRMKNQRMKYKNKIYQCS